MKKIIKLSALAVIFSTLFGCANPANDSGTESIAQEEVGKLSVIDPATNKETKLVETYVSSEEQVVEVLKEIFVSFNSTKSARAVDANAKEQLTHIIDDVSGKIPEIMRAYTAISSGNWPDEDIMFDEEFKLDSITPVDAVDTAEDFILTVANSTGGLINAKSITKELAPAKAVANSLNEYGKIENLLLSANFGYKAADKTIKCATKDKVKATVTNIEKLVPTSPIKGAGVSVAYVMDIEVNMEKAIKEVQTITNPNAATEAVLKAFDSYNLEAESNIMLAVATSKKLGGYFNFDIKVDVPQDKLATMVSTSATADMIRTMNDCYKISLTVTDDDGKTTFEKEYSVMDFAVLIM